MWDASETSHGCNGAVSHSGAEGTTHVVAPTRVVALASSEEHRRM
jgi:hypothetical protein